MLTSIGCSRLKTRGKRLAFDDSDDFEEDSHGQDLGMTGLVSHGAGAKFTNIAACNGRRAGYCGTEFDQTLPGGRCPLLVRLNSENLMMMPRRMNPRVEYRLQHIQRVNDSASLAATFPRLKSLTVDLTYFEAGRLTKNGELRYKVNVQHAKSLFSFVCPNGECIGGGFDLSTSVADAVETRRKIVEGQIECTGSCTKPKQGGTVPCHNLLRYKLSFGYV